MNHQCPNCGREYDAELNYCRKCGEPSKASPKNSANVPVDNHQATGGPSASNVTTHINEFFPSKACPVELSPDAEDGARKADAPPQQEAKASDPAPDEQSRTDAETQLPRAPEPMAAEAYYRSIRTLAITTVICNALATTAVVTLALIFSSSIESTSNKAQQSLIETSRENAKMQREAVETATTKTAESLIAELRRDREQQRRKFEADVIDEAKRAGREAARHEVAEARLDLLPKTLNADERKTIASAFAKARDNTKDKKMRSDLAAFNQKILNNKADRKAAYKEANRLLTNLDKSTRVLVEDDVVKTFLGD